MNAVRVVRHRLEVYDAKNCDCHEIILNVFPGLEGRSINPIFYSGIIVYLVGAVIYFFINKKEKADRRRREIEESYKAAGLGDSDDDASREGAASDSDENSNK